jgi:hypothetical protein
MDRITEAFVTIVGLVIGVATLSVIVSNNSNTTGVIQNLFSGVGNLLSVATAPVTGATLSPTTAYVASSAGGLLSGLGSTGFP